MRPLRRFAFPEALIFALGLLVTRVVSWREAVQPMAQTLVAVALVVGALLAMRFHRGRMLLLVLLLAIADQVMVAAAMLPGLTARASLELLAVLVPVNFALLAMLPERGALTNAGLLRLGAFGSEALAAAAMAVQAAPPTLMFLEYPVLPPDIFAWTPLPQYAIALSVAALLLFVLLWLREPSPIARGMFWSLLATMCALQRQGAGAESSLWIAVAAIILALSVVESSYVLAFHDALTGLPGRRALHQALQHAGNRYVVAMVDVDHFKQCNDKWGHDVGDQVLKMVASRLETVGGGGRAFRYGGEEFALLFANQDADSARPWLERVRVAVEDASFAIRNRPRPNRKPARRKTPTKMAPAVAVTISIGLAQGNDSAMADNVIAAADQALYRAKETGRNRIEG